MARVLFYKGTNVHACLQNIPLTNMHDLNIRTWFNECSHCYLEHIQIQPDSYESLHKSHFLYKNNTIDYIFKNSKDS